MSIQALGWCIKQKTDTPTTKLVLFVLSNYADENGTCYPSEKHLSNIVGVSDRQIRRCLKWLINNQLIKAQQRKGTSNRYYLCMDTDVLPVRTPTSANTKDNTKDIYTKAFHAFWETYPRKVGKYLAAKAFEKSTKEIETKELIKATKRFAESHKNTEERFIPHASSWLNGKRYFDEQVVKKKTINSLAG
jgi:DNA-binding FadR family transcriptional regulator